MQSNYSKVAFSQADKDYASLRKTFYSPLKVTSPNQIHSIKVNNNKDKTVKEMTHKRGKSFCFSQFINKLELIDGEIDCTDRTDRNSRRDLDLKTSSIQETLKNSPVNEINETFDDLSQDFGIVNQQEIKKNTRKLSANFSGNFNDQFRGKFKTKEFKNCLTKTCIEHDSIIKKTEDKRILSFEKKEISFENKEIIFEKLFQLLKNISEMKEISLNKESFSMMQDLLKIKTEIADYMNKIHENLAQSPVITKVSKENHMKISETNYIYVSNHLTKLNQNQESSNQTNFKRNLTIESTEKVLISLKRSDINQSNSCKISELEQSITQLQESLEKNHSDYSNLKNQHKSSLILIKNLQDSICLLREENLLLDNQFKHAKTLIENLSNKSSKVFDRYKEQKNYNESLIKIIKDFQKKEYGEMDQEKNEENSKSQELYDDLEIVKNECKRLSDANRELMVEDEKIKRKYKEIIEDCARLEKEIECLKQDLKLASDQISELKTENLRISHLNEFLKGEHSKMKIDCMAYKDTLKIFEDKINEMNS